MVTVFTPTYNRLYKIDKLYQSLKRQSCNDFEWIVVDDGSNDGTKEYFEKVIDNGDPFKIRYFNKENGGKHRAINLGVSQAKGNLFFIVDSDDYLIDNAIEMILEWEAGLDKSHKWGGVAGSRGYSKDKVIGNRNLRFEYVDAKATERDKYNLTGDKAEVFFTDVLRKYPFPEIEGEKFITEDSVWLAIARDGYYIRWYPNIIYIGEYLSDGLTKNSNSIFAQNPEGVLYWAKLVLEVYRHNGKKKFSAISRYYYAVRDNKTKKEIALDLDISLFTLNYAILTVYVGRKIRSILK